jgi:hypothetical protein
MPPQGWYFYRPSRYSDLQRYDPRARLWRQAGDDGQSPGLVYFDGTTIRLANPTGCAVAAVVTTAGSAYATAPTVTASAGGSKWTAILGGAISTLGVINTGGAGYVYPPMLWIEQPPQPGVQAGGYISITNGTISAITITEQGAGYLFPPLVEVINDPRDITGYGGNVSVNLTGSGTVTAVVCNDHGNPITSGTVPTLAFGSGSAAATVVMDWCVNSVSVTTAGAGYGVSAAVTLSAAGGFVTATPSYLGGFSSVGVSKWRAAIIDMATAASTGALTSTYSIIDGGRYQSVPFPVITSAGLALGTGGVLVFTMGGQNAALYLQPAQQ